MADFRVEIEGAEEILALPEKLDTKSLVAQAAQIAAAKIRADLAAGRGARGPLKPLAAATLARRRRRNKGGSDSGIPLVESGDLLGSITAGRDGTITISADNESRAEALTRYADDFGIGDDADEVLDALVDNWLEEQLK